MQNNNFIIRNYIGTFSRVKLLEYFHVVQESLKEYSIGTLLAIDLDQITTGQFKLKCCKLKRTDN